MIKNCDKQLKELEAPEFKGKDTNVSDLQQMYKNRQNLALNSSLNSSKVTSPRSLKNSPLLSKQATDEIPKKRYKRNTLRKTIQEKVDPEVYREQSLNEIFHFYCRQHIPVNVKFDDLATEMKKLDHGEINCLMRDFEVELPRMKITELFKKVSINNQALEYKEFKEMIKDTSKEYSLAKFKENKARHAYYQKIVDQLEIPQSYENPMRDKAYDKKVNDVLNSKMERYTKYVESQLKQNNLLSESIPVIVPKKPKKYEYYKYKGGNNKKAEEEKKTEDAKEEKKADPAPPVQPLPKPDPPAEGAKDGDKPQVQPFSPRKVRAEAKQRHEENSKRFLNEIDKMEPLDDILMTPEQIAEAKKEVARLEKEAEEERLRLEAEEAKRKEEERIAAEKKAAEEKRRKEEEDRRRAEELKRKMEEEEDEDDDEENEDDDDDDEEEKEETKEQQDEDEEENKDQVDELEEEQEAEQEQPVEPEEPKKPEPPKIPNEIIHPIHTKMKEIQDFFTKLAEVITSDQKSYDWMCDDVLGLNSRQYRKKIKGFHLAFNTKEKTNEVSTYKYQPEGTAEEIRLKMIELRNRRIYQKEVRDKEE